MGMFDEVTIRCVKCGETFIEQSKGGACQMRTFPVESAPADVLTGLADRVYCPKCSTCMRIEVVAFTRVHEVIATEGGDDY